MPSKLIVVLIEKLDPNPHRDLATYPWIERKIEQLKSSIGAVGLWEGIIVRPKGDRFEMAFGHHRLEAARRVGLTEISVIVRDLTDEDMLKFMGRENGEDYASDFIVMLNTWEGAMRFLSPKGDKVPQPVEIARLIGWTLIRGAGVRKGENTISPVARACSAAYALLKRGYVDRSDLDGLNVSQAREFLERCQSQAEDLERRAVEKKTPIEDFNRVKKRFSVSIKHTANEVREGRVAQRDIRKTVDLNTRGQIKKDEPASPLFTDFAASLLKSLQIALDTDIASQYLTRVEEALPFVTLDKDRMILSDIQHELGKISVRAMNWQKRLVPQKVALRVIANETNDDKGEEK